jgi:hypothetical protein
MLSKSLMILTAAATLALSHAAPAHAQFFGVFGGGTNLSEGDCQALERTVGPKGVWFSQFSGAHNDPWDRGKVHASGVGCFKTYAQCKAWLYRSQSDWPQLMDFTFCKRGLPAR